jgi:hypothetical protein
MEDRTIRGRPAFCEQLTAPGFERAALEGDASLVILNAHVNDRAVAIKIVEIHAMRFTRYPIPFQERARFNNVDGSNRLCGQGRE